MTEPPRRPIRWSESWLTPWSPRSRSPPRTPRRTGNVSRRPRASGGRWPVHRLLRSHPRRPRRRGSGRRLRTPPRLISAPPQRLVRASVQPGGHGANPSSTTESPCTPASVRAGRRGPRPCGHDKPRGRRRGTAWLSGPSTIASLPQHCDSPSKRIRPSGSPSPISTPSPKRPQVLSAAARRTGNATTSKWSSRGRRRRHSSRRPTPRTPRQRRLRPTRRSDRCSSRTVEGSNDRWTSTLSSCDVAMLSVDGCCNLAHAVRRSGRHQAARSLEVTTAYLELASTTKRRRRHTGS